MNSESKRLASLPMTAVLSIACGCMSTLGCATNDVQEQADSSLPLGSAPAFEKDDTVYRQELASLDASIAHFEGIADDKPSSWLSLQNVATAHLQRARLTGGYEGYAAAESALEEAFERAVDGSGPLMTQASLDFSLHRFDAVEASVSIVANRPVLDDPTRAAVEALRADVLFNTGAYDEALTKYVANVELDHQPSHLSRLALYRWKTGDFDTAEALYLEAQDDYHGTSAEPHAWFHLQLGIMDLERGRYEDAFEHYADAADELGGYYLIEEHIAEIFVLLGYEADAEALYRKIIDETESPEFMDALAGLLIARDGDGNAAEAQQWVARARTLYDAQLVEFPEAAYGHALAHFMEFGTPEEALEIAELNHDNRPNADAKVALAEAQLRAGEVQAAVDTVEEALETPIRTAALHFVASQAYALAGDDVRAQEQHEAATAINPDVG